jgi:hypothetical protein
MNTALLLAIVCQPIWTHPNGPADAAVLRKAVNAYLFARRANLEVAIAKKIWLGRVLVGPYHLVASS